MVRLSKTGEESKLTQIYAGDILRYGIERDSIAKGSLNYIRGPEGVQGGPKGMQGGSEGMQGGSETVCKWVPKVARGMQGGPKVYIGFPRYARGTGRM